MTPETISYLIKARQQLSQAEIILNVGLPDAAGRAAYLAGFHAAQALIFERARKVSKTHTGVRAEFARLAQSERLITEGSRAFLGRAYNLKTVADYGTDPSYVISCDQAGDAIDAAKAMVEQVEASLVDDIK